MSLADLIENKKVLNLQVLIVDIMDDGLTVADENNIAFLAVPVESKYKLNAVISILKPKLVEKTSKCVIIKPNSSFAPTILKNAEIKIPAPKLDEMMDQFSYVAPKNKLFSTLSTEEEVDLEVYITGSTKCEKPGQTPYSMFLVLVI